MAVVAEESDFEREMPDLTQMRSHFFGDGVASHFIDGNPRGDTFFSVRVSAR